MCVQEVVVVVAGNFYNKYGNGRDLFDIWPGQAVLQSERYDLMMILKFDRYNSGPALQCNISLVTREMRIINDNKITGSALPPSCTSAVMREARQTWTGPGTIGIISPRQTICSSLVCHADNILLIKPTKVFLHQIIEEFKHQSIKGLSPSRFYDKY